MRRGVNETIDTVNWLMGMRTDSGHISDGGRGPVISIPSAAATGPTPWATDPDGNAAGWQRWQVCVNGVTVNKWFWGTP